jgi:transposase
MDAYSEDLRK